MKKKDVLLVDYSNRFIWFDGEISQKIAKKFTRILKKLNKLKCFPVVFYIRGVGGDPYASMEIMNEILNSDSPVATIAHGFVRSGCFTITQAGKHRLALAGTRFSFHRAVPCFKKPLTEPYAYHEEFIDHLERLRMIDAIQFAWFARKGRPVKEVFDLFNDDKTINLKKAKKLGLIDDYYKREDFIRDRKIVNRMKKAAK